MIRFRGIWDLYERGTIKEEAAIDKTGVSKLKSREGRNINQIIDEIITLKTDHIEKELDSFDPLNADGLYIETLLEDIEEGEKKVKSLSEMRNSENGILGHAIRVIKVGDRLDKIILDAFNKAYEPFDTSDKQLEKADEDEINSARKKADNDYIVCKKVFDLIERRRIISEVKDKAKHVQQYGEEKEKISSIKKEIADLYERYRSVPDNKRAAAKFKKIRKEIANSMFLTSSLHKRCDETDYREGNLRLDELEKDLDYVIKNFDKGDNIREVRRAVKESIPRLKRYVEVIRSMKEDSLSVKDLSQLTEMWDIAANQRFTEYRNIIFLNEDIYNHDEASETIMKKASSLMRNEAKKLSETYRIVETGSMQFPRKFEEISRYFFIVEDMNKSLEEVSKRFTALGYNQDSWRADNLIEKNKKRVQEIKGFEKEYDKIWDIKKQVKILEKEVKEKGANNERIERLIKLNSRPRGCSTKIENNALEEDYDSKLKELNSDISSAVNSLIEAVDNRYAEAEKNPSYHLDNIVELYQQINTITDISERIERCYALQEQREKENKERELKGQIAELEKQREELEEKNQLTEKKSEEYGYKIDELKRSLEESEAGKKTSEEQKAELEKRLSLKESEILKYRTAVNNLRATYARLEIEKKTGSEYAQGLKAELDKRELELNQAEAKKADFQGRIESLTEDLTRAKDELEKEKEAHQDELTKTRETYNDKLTKAKDELAKARSVYQKDDIAGRLMSEAKSSGSFNFYEYIRNSPEPETYSLLSLKDILEGRTGERDVFERFNKFSDYLCSMKFQDKPEDRKFLEYINQGIEDDISKGKLGKKIGASTYRRGIVNDTLNLIRSILE